MLTKNIKFQNYQFKKKFPIVKRLFEKIKKENLQKKNDLFLSLTTDYKLSYDKKLITKLKRFSIFRIIGMGGSILGSQAIYHFLKDKIKKKFYFLNNLQPRVDFNKKDKKIINLIISKSGNTLETISNTKLLLNNKKKSVFIIGNQRSYLRNLANKMKSQIIEHNNFIGGRYSVLSEVGILPAELMGLNSKKFKQFNFLIKNKKFISQLVQNVESTLYFVKKKNILQ